jgi:hypothetical protein
VERRQAGELSWAELDLAGLGGTAFVYKTLDLLSTTSHEHRIRDRAVLDARAATEMKSRVPASMTEVP